MTKIFALIDCNNFFVSCERVFNPKLHGRPVVVLSNNDGCIVARSEEVKALGIPMAAPLHQYRQLLSEHQAAILSSNYQLYGDMSHRVMRSLSLLVDDLEVYSIDEAFLNLDYLSDSSKRLATATHIRQMILQWTGIPTSIGIAPSKTLAKLANYYAKKQTNSQGVVDLCDPLLQEQLMATLPVEKLWGISHRLGASLRAVGINSALELRNADRAFIRQRFSVVVERLVHELRGLPCLELTNPQPRKNIISSRSFGKLVTSQQELAEAVANYTARAAEKLRRQQSKATAIYVFIRTNPFRKQMPQYKASQTIALDSPTSDTGTLISKAKSLLAQIYQPGFHYHKAGVMLLDLINESEQQGQLFATSARPDRQELMAVMDQLNHKMGRNTVFSLAQGSNELAQQQWRLKCDLRSPRYTTNWQELAIVH